MNNIMKIYNYGDEILLLFTKDIEELNEVENLLFPKKNLNNGGGF